ncbi:MAG: homocysteine S-methyltransferase family protein [Tepidisphaeraceae bacterium]
MSPTLLKTIADGTVLLCDGAMGTQLQALGMTPGVCGELWNVDHPERVAGIHRAYVDAGADCIITNTFGANAITLERHGLASRAAELNRAGVRVAKSGLGPRGGFVLGDVGPFGGFLEPLGDVPEQAVRDAFTVQCDALVEAGADAIIVETQVALDELAIAIDCARKAGATCVIASVAYDPSGTGELRTMMGTTPEEAATAAKEAGAHIIALNCGRGMDMQHAAKCVGRYRAACNLPTMAQPNAGSPVLVEGKVTYRQTPEAMAHDLPLLLEAGVNIVGACCGSTPAHIAALRPMVDAHNRKRQGVK